jgi:uncharacterized membrane protein YdjX (TVP38/TMEM64 family)
VSPIRRRFAINLLVGCLFSLGVVLLAWRKDDALHRAAARLLGPVEAAGPWVYFGALTLLPAVGVPATPFALGAAPAFAARLGIGGVLAATVAAITANLALTYALARWVLGERAAALLRRAGFELPAMDRGDALDAIVLVRVVPALPFAVQNYLLGFARVPFGLYLAVSGAIQGCYAAAFVLLGESALHGSAARLIGAAGLLLALAALAHFTRRHFGSARAGGGCSGSLAAQPREGGP